MKALKVCNTEPEVAFYLPDDVKSDSEASTDLPPAGTYASVVLKLRMLVNAVRSSPQRRKVYEAACRAKNLTVIMVSLDCPTRWNSSLEMIKTAIKQKKALHEVDFSLYTNEFFLRLTA